MSAPDYSLVSVVVPVYNEERFLQESLDSLLNQSYPNLEIIVIDDASTDDTPQILDTYGGQIHQYRNKKNRGIYESMNRGIERAEGKYVAIYHADDVYHPNIVEREVEFLERYPEAGAVFCKDIFIDENGREYDRLQLPPEVQGERPLDYPTVLNAMLRNMNSFLRCPSCMARASVYQDIGRYQPSRFFNTSDLDMYLRISQKYSIGIIEDYLFRYRHSPQQSSHQYHNLRTDPNRFFRIIDHYLENGGNTVAQEDSLIAYEGHRAEDHLMRAVNHYILEELPQARDQLDKIRLRTITQASQLQRSRLFILYFLMQVLTKLPRIPFLATIMYRRWHIQSS